MATREPRQRQLSNREMLFASEAGNDGGGNNINPFALAMQLLGMQQQRRQLGEEREFEREKLGEQRGFEREKLGSEERRAAERLGLEQRQQTETELTGKNGERNCGDTRGSRCYRCDSGCRTAKSCQRTCTAKVDCGRAGQDW